MVSSDNEGKDPSKDDLLDPAPEEEVESEAEEEVEEDRRSYHHTTIASIGVMENSRKFKKNARMRTGGGVPRHILAQKTPPSGNKNHFHTLIHQYPFQKVPKSELPSAWDFDRSNNAGKGNSEFKEEEWGKGSSSWDSPYDRLMNRVEHNTKLIHNLTYKVDDLMELVKRLIKDSSSPPKE